MAKSRLPKNVVVLDAKASTGWGSNIDVSDYRHIMVSVASASSANLTVKFAGSFLDYNDVDFTSAAAVDNEWDYVASYDLEDVSSIEGDTGVVFSGTDDCRQLIINVDGLRTLNANVTARSAGSVTVKLFAVNNA